MRIKIIKKILFLTTIITIAIAASLNLSACKAFENAVGNFETFEVTRGDIIQTISASGYVDSVSQHSYSLTASGKVVFTLNEGDLFSKGDLLFEIDTSRQKLLIAQAEENLNLAQNSLELARISYQQALDVNHTTIQLAAENTRLSEQSVKNALTALEDANEYLGLVKESGMSTDLQITQAETQSRSLEGSYYQAQINQSSAYWSNLSSTQSTESQIDAAAKNIEQAEIQLRLSEISLNLAKMDIDKSIIHAPYNGTVLSSGYRQGEYASPGIPVISIISSDFIIKADVNETDAVSLEIGQEVDIRLDAYYDSQFYGKITEISPISTNIGGVVSFEIVVEPEEENSPELLYGLSASLDITTSGAENVLYVPIQYIYEEDGKSYVDILNEDGTTERKEVTTGVFNYDYIEIKSGLGEGDIISVSSI